MLVASLDPLLWAEWVAKSTPPCELTAPAFDERHLVLTDDYAPSDSMLLPVFVERGWM